VHTVARAVDTVLCLLPFEPECYAGTRVRALFVGHPAARVQAVPKGPGFVVGLAPGSRPSEVAAHWPAFRAAAERIRARRSDVRFQIAVAPTIDPAALEGLDAVRCRGVAEAAVGAHAFLVATGTATIELAARGIPMVAACRVHPLTWAVGRRIVRVRHLALPNLLAGRTVVPEHVQCLDPMAMAADVLRVACDPAMPATLREIAERLDGEGAAERIAAEVYRAGSEQVTVPNAASQRPHGVLAHLS
jgi:lipid-A-disaccharide synthase